MRKTIYVIVAVALLFFCEASAQGLKAGDKVSDVTFNEILNYSKTSARLSEFRGKPLLIDAWATWCMPCIASMPEMHELQRKFDGQVQILLLNAGEKRERVQRFIDKRKGIKTSEITLPVIVDHTGALKKEVFNAQGLPAIYWIDASGRLIDITDKYAVTEENIRALLSGTPLTTRERINSLPADTSALSWTSRMERTKVQEPPAMRFFFSKDSTQNLSCRSCTVLDLFRLANGEPVTKYRIPYIIPVSVSRTSIDERSGSSLGKHMGNFTGNGDRFDYLLTCARGTTLKKMAARMNDEIRNWFNLDATKRVHSTNYLSLQCFDTLKIAYRSGELRYNIKDVVIGLNKVTVKSFLANQEQEISNGRYFFPPYPIVDDTGFQGMLGDINLEGDMRDYKVVDHALRPYGMQLKMLRGPLEVLFVYPRE